MHPFLWQAGEESGREKERERENESQRRGETGIRGEKMGDIR